MPFCSSAFLLSPLLFIRDYYVDIYFSLSPIFFFTVIYECFVLTDASHSLMILGIMCYLTKLKILFASQ